MRRILAASADSAPYSTSVRARVVCRLVQAGVAPCVLDTQYRMHPAIAEFPSDCFYGGRIRDGITALDRPAPLGL